MRWKWIVGIIAAICVVLLVVAYIIAASYDYNKLKPLITRTVKDFTGRELTIGGDFDLKIGLPPSLEVHNVAFQNAAWGSQPQMARFKKLQVSVSLLPLIRGNIDVNRLILTEPVLSLEVMLPIPATVTTAPPGSIRVSWRNAMTAWTTTVTACWMTAWSMSTMA